jgi:hypothetical protein
VLKASSRTRDELEQLFEAGIQYDLSLPVAIERCCRINANHAETID